MIAISQQLTLPVAGLFRRVTSGVYVKLFYTSVAANTVKTFRGTEDFRQFELPRGYRTIMEKLCFGVLSFDEDIIAGKDLKELSPDDCARIVHEGFFMDPARVPELYYNETFKVQLETMLEPKGFKVLSQNCGTRELLPYNPYWRSNLDLAVLKDSNNSLLMSSQIVTPPPNNNEDERMDEDEDEDKRKMLCVELKRVNESKAQMYAEAWNLAIHKLLHKRTTRKKIMSSTVTVYCILSCEKCKRGLLSAISLDVKNSSCKLFEDEEEHPILDCFNIALSLMSNCDSDVM